MKVKEFVSKNLNKKISYKIDDLLYPDSSFISSINNDKEIKNWAINKYEGIIVIKTI